MRIRVTKRELANCLVKLLNCHELSQDNLAEETKRIIEKTNAILEWLDAENGEEENQ